METRVRVAIQGKLGSFHHIVAQRYFGDRLSLVACNTFDSSVRAVIKDNADLAVMAIENSIAGSIIPNYALIDQNDLKIIGEYGLSIHHNFMALPDQKIEDIKEVHSHPMALLQCKNFFQNYPNIVKVESEANQISIPSVLNYLGSINIKDVLLEAGPRLISSFIDLNLIDEYIFYIAPKVLGNKANSFYTNKNLEGILNSPDLEIVEEKSIGRDLKLVLRKKNAS